MNLPAHRDPAHANIIPFPNRPPDPAGDAFETSIALQRAAQRFVREISAILAADECPVQGCGANLADRDHRQRAVHMGTHGIVEQVKARLRGWRG